LLTDRQTDKQTDAAALHNVLGGRNDEVLVSTCKYLK